MNQYMHLLALLALSSSAGKPGISAAESLSESLSMDLRRAKKGLDGD